MTKIRQTLLSEHGGSTAMETTILAPLMFMTFMALMYFLMMVLAWVAYTNAASSIAHQMNMRQTGYTRAVNTYCPGGAWRPPTLYSCQLRTTAGDRYTGEIAGTTLNLMPGSSQLRLNNDTLWCRAGVYFALDAAGRGTGRDRNNLDFIADQFILPFVQVDSIEVNTSQPIDFSGGGSDWEHTGHKQFVNIVIQVIVRFHVVNPIGVLNGLRETNEFNAGLHTPQGYSSHINIKAVGYDVIA